MSCPREGPKSSRPFSGALCDVSLSLRVSGAVPTEPPFTGSVSQTVHAILALGLMSWFGLSPQFFWPKQSLDAKSSKLGALTQPRSSGLCLPPSDAQSPRCCGTAVAHAWGCD